MADVKIQVAEELNRQESVRANLLMTEQALETQLENLASGIEDNVQKLLKLADGIKQVIIVSNTAYLVDPKNDLIEVIPMTKKIFG